MNAQQFSPPANSSKPIKEQLHGVTLIDSYRHLEDKENPEVISWTKQQHDATMKYLKETAPDISGLNDEIRTLFDREVTSPPRIKREECFSLVEKKANHNSSIIRFLLAKNNCSLIR